MKDGSFYVKKVDSFNQKKVDKEVDVDPLCNVLGKNADIGFEEKKEEKIPFFIT